MTRNALLPTPVDTALIYIHSPRYAEIGAALERLPVTLLKLPYNRFFLPGHALAITLRVPGVGEFFSRQALARIAALPQQRKIVLTDRLLLDSWFVERLKAMGCRYVVRLRGDAWRECDEVEQVRWWWTPGKAAWYRRVWFHNLEAADAIWPLARHLESVVLERCPGKPTAVVGSLRDLPSLPNAGLHPSPPVPGPDGGVGDVRVMTATVYMFRQKTAGVLRLYDLMEAAMGRWPGVTWSLCGDGRHFARSRARWQASPMRSRIEFPGRVADLKRRMGKSHVFAYCSEMDVLPNVVLDAMAAGLPVLCNRWGSFPEIFAGELDWCLYADEAEFLQKLERLATDPEHWRRVADAGIERVREMFSAERVREELERALAGLSA
ncbi:MAG: glycosyltransferase family 4 protein [Nitrospirota bacterium]|nr:glycosyltransferase family 4 protein [Nitrospirota bacterium]